MQVSSAFQHRSVESGMSQPQRDDCSQSQHSVLALTQHNRDAHYMSTFLGAVHSIKE